MTFKIGIGYDIHKLVSGRALILGGVNIPFEKGLLGHSDGDALSHAISDAILGALGLGDIGKHFPDTDPKYEDADSLKLLQKVAEMAQKKGWMVSNLDANVITELPKLMPHIDSMREKIARSLGVEKDCVSVKARTNEKLDAIGRGEAIAAQAIILLKTI